MRFLVRSRKDAAFQSISLATQRLCASSRSAQIEQIAELRREDPAEKELGGWLDDAVMRGEVKSVSAHQTAMPVTGVRVLEMTDAEAGRLRREMPGVVVMADRPLELIRPVKRPASAPLGHKDTVSVEDLWHLRAIGLEQARAEGFTGTGHGVVVAVLDTGVDSTHPELRGRIARAVTFDVSADTAHPMNPSWDTHGHGTHVSGLVCGKTVGVAPGATVWSGVMLPEGRGWTSDFIVAMEWAAKEPDIAIVNMSAGLPGFLPEMEAAVAGLLPAGVFPVFAIGNEGLNHTRSPGNYRDVLSVGATDKHGNVASFSGGATMVVNHHQYVVPDVVAPGDDIYSCVMGGGFENWDGTSMATPVVSGIAALILEKYPLISVMDLLDAVCSTCKNLGKPADRQGAGLVQVTYAVNHAQTP